MELSALPTCQSPGGLPGRLFSQAIALTTGGPHGLPVALAAVHTVNGVRAITASNGVNLLIRRSPDAAVPVVRPVRRCDITITSTAVTRRRSAIPLKRPQHS